jgi:hypothetical protein
LQQSDIVTAGPLGRLLATLHHWLGRVTNEIMLCVRRLCFIPTCADNDP